VSGSAERRPLILRAGGAIAITTIASGVETAQRPTLSAVEQLAAYFYADTLVLLRRTGLHLAQALAVAAFADDPDLFLKLLTADLEQLLKDQLLAEVALAAAEPEPGDRGRYTVRSCARYELRRAYEYAATGDGVRPIERTGDPAAAALAARAVPQLLLLARWQSIATPERRHKRMVAPHYTFVWETAGEARFAETDASTQAPETEARWEVVRLAEPPAMPVEGV
jgi:hypothetical protein